MIILFELMVPCWESIKGQSGNEAMEWYTHRRRHRPCCGECRRRVHHQLRRRASARSAGGASTWEDNQPLIHGNRGNTEKPVKKVYNSWLGWQPLRARTETTQSNLSMKFDFTWYFCYCQKNYDFVCIAHNKRKIWKKLLFDFKCK